MTSSSEQMGNEEITQLRELKDELLKKVIYLRDRLKDQEENGCREPINFNTTLFSDDENQKLSESLSTKYKARLCEITGKMMGITFKDVDRKWLHDNVYTYTAKVTTKTISFNIELTVTFKDSNNFKIENIMCHFIDVHDCYLLEISPWFQKIANMKNFSFLMSALSDYNENNLFRSKILNDLKLKQYLTIERYTLENGGMLIHIHSPVNTEKSYVTCQWAMKFLDSTWRIEHFFTVKPTNLGMEFSEENRSLLKEFCKYGLTENDLVELWDRMCIAIDAYAKKNIYKN